MMGRKKTVSVIQREQSGEKHEVSQVRVIKTSPAVDSPATLRNFIQFQVITVNSGKKMGWENCSVGTVELHPKGS